MSQVDTNVQSPKSYMAEAETPCVNSQDGSPEFDTGLWTWLDIGL
jgi:hypothetical protein